MDKNAKKQNVLGDEALDKISGGKINISDIFNSLKNIIKEANEKAAGKSNNDSILKR